MQSASPAGQGSEAEYRAFLHEGGFMIQWSRSTGTHVFFPCGMVPGTGERDLEWVEASGDLAVFLASDSAQDFTGQVFATRHNEIFLMSQSCPVRSVHRGKGWTPELIKEHAAPALRPSLHALDRSQDVFAWDPI